MSSLSYYKSRQAISARGRKLALLCSATALSVLFGPSMAFAQTAATQPPATDDAVLLDEFVVTGVRASLISAQEVKENSFQFVDSIVAQDIGKFPDNTVADALQRVPGIQVGRGGGEVSAVRIRGLPNFATTLNGHEIFTGTGRGVALQDLPAELISSVDVYKSNAPDQIEGGIAGLIDIRLRKPLDFKGFTLAGGGRGIYSDNSKKGSYTANALASNRWKLSNGGEFGALFAASFQHGRYLDQTIFNFDFEPHPTTAIPGRTQIIYPGTVGSLLSPVNRDRTAYNLSLQWKPSTELELYTDFLYMNYRNTHDVHFFIGIPGGEILSATFVPGTDIAKTLDFRNSFQLTSQQEFKDKTDNYQAVAGAKWKYNDVKLTTEYVYNWSSVKNRAVIVDTQFTRPSAFTQFGSNADYHYDFNKDGEGASDVRITGDDIRNGDNYALWGLFDNHGYATSHQNALKFDMDAAIKQGFLTNFQTGLRYTDREAKNRQTNVNNLEPVGGRGVVRASSIPGFMTQAPDAKGEFGVQNWGNADPDFLRDNVGRVRQLFGQPVTDPNFDPTQAFTDTEKTYSAYAQARYKAMLGTLPLDGLFGLRVVKTKETLQGNLTNGTPIDGDKSDTQVLPVINGRLKLQNNLQLRASAGRAITRPDFSALNPVVSLTAPTTTGTALGSGSGGNPNLESVTSDNYDLALEYYFAKGSYVSLAGFYRSIDGYVQSFASIETIGGVGYVVTRPRNSGKGHLDGIEATYQHFFDFLPPALKGLGVQTNFTYIEGENDVADTSPSAPVGARVKQAYAQVSKYNYNIVGIYEKGPFSARVAYNWRGKYVETFDGPNRPGDPLRVISVKPRGQLDLSASYELRKGLSITADVINVLNNKYQDYFGPDSSATPRDTRFYDTTYSLGVRYVY